MKIGAKAVVSVHVSTMVKVCVNVCVSDLALTLVSVLVNAIAKLSISAEHVHRFCFLLCALRLGTFPPHVVVLLGNISSN